MRAALLLVFLVLAACRAAGEARSAAAPTHVVLILTDDQGYGDYGSMGNAALDTPNLDRLAARAARIERFYVNPVCSATRASLLTGRYAYRTRVVDTWRGRSMMDPDEVTLAEILRERGYRTGIFGKWHLGDNYPLRPRDQGFDECLVHRGGGLAQLSDPLENARRYTNPILVHNGVETATRGYCTDVYFDAALAFIDDAVDSGRPFFTYIAPNAPHNPLHDVPPELLAKYRSRDLSAVARDGADVDRVARVYAMIDNIDQNVGRLLEHLERRGLTERTLVVFLGDNGPTPGRYVAGLRGHKTSVYEGGIRTPLFLTQGERYRDQALARSVGAHIDLLPTILGRLGVERPEGVALDGRDLFEAAAPSALVLQSHRGDVPVAEHQFAVLRRHHKLLRASGFGREQPSAEAPFELYDLRADPGEKHNLATEEPELVATLLTEYRRWFADVSATRPDNYAPPRIVLDAAAEPRCLLTRQDWRAVPNGGGTGDGMWQLRVPSAQARTVTLLFRKPRRVERVVIELGERQRLERPGGAAATGALDLGRLTLRRGDLDLRIRVHGPDGEAAPYQVVLDVE
ncbi:MAG: arylsulfatase [Planctomycetota bacterium]